MKTHFNDVEYAKKMAQKGLTTFPPAIPFEKPAEPKSSDEEKEKDKYKTFDVKIDKSDTLSDTIEYSIKVFEEGTPEQFVQWFEQYQELEQKTYSKGLTWSCLTPLWEMKSPLIKRYKQP